MSDSYPSTSDTGNSEYTSLDCELWCEYPVSPSSDWKSNAVPVQSRNVSAISPNPSSKRNTPSKSRFFGLQMSACGSTCSLMNCFVSPTSAIWFVTPSTNFSNGHSSSLLQAYHSKSG